jgi:hypothetical protein
MRRHFRHPQAMFNKGLLFYSHCGLCPSLQRDTNKVNKKYKNKIQVLTTTIIGEQQQQDGAEIPPLLQQNIILLSKNEIKTIISTPKVWCCEKNSPWEFKL